MTAGLVAPNPIIDKILWFGAPPIRLPVEIAEVTNIAKCIPGRLMCSGTRLGSGAGYTAYDVYLAADAMSYRPMGWLGYDDVDTNVRPADRTKAYASGVEVGVYKGKGFGILACLYSYMAIKAEDLVCNWTDGCVAGPAVPASGGVFLGIPFSLAAASEANTHVVIPKGMIVKPDSFVEVTTEGAITLDVGFLSTEDSGDPDGLMNAASMAAAGLVQLLEQNAGSTGDETVGDLMKSGSPTELKDKNDVFFVTAKGYVVATSGTGRTVSITPSGATAVAGIVWLHLVSPNLRIVGQAEESVTTTTSVSEIRLTSEL